MNQLILSGFDEELAGKIQRVANQEGISLNQAALRLMRFGAGLGQPRTLATLSGRL